MAYFVGMDVSKHSTSICVIDAEGEVVSRGVVASEAKAIVAFLRGAMKTLPRVRTEMSLQILAYNLGRVIERVGVGPLVAAITA